MPNPFGAPEISVHDVKRKLDGDEVFVWLDVREPYELSAPPSVTTGSRPRRSADWRNFKWTVCPKKRRTRTPQLWSFVIMACAAPK